MKTIMKILLMLLFFFAVACSDDGSNTVIITDPNPEPPIEIPSSPNNPNGPIPPEQLENIQIVLHTSQSTKFTDGKTIWTWQEGKVKKAKSKIYTHDNVVYRLNDTGATTQARNLVTVPSGISIDPVYEEVSSKSVVDKPIDLSASGIWIIEHITAQEAFDMGALFKPYTKIYKDSNEQGNWFDNQYECENIIVHDGDIYNKLSTGAWISVTGNKSNINHVEPDGFALYNFDVINHTATIDGIDVEFDYNFLSNAKWWLYSDTQSKWYSVNGYTWDGTNLVEEASAMWDFRQQSNIMLDAGTREENGETVMYWINCATGYVIRYVPSVDQYVEYVRLYTGDGDLATGVFYKGSLSPVIEDNYLYFIFDAQVYRYNFTTGLTSHFTTGVSVMWEY